MTDFNETAWLWAARGAGAVAGSAVSLAYILPSGAGRQPFALPPEWSAAWSSAAPPD